MSIYTISKSNNANKKWMVKTPDGKVVHFGAKGYEDYTIHKDEDRMKRYIIRHKKNENWGKRGINTPGFWSRWLLWNKPSLTASIRDMQNRFNIKINKK
jgi:hypothetical protein